MSKSSNNNVKRRCCAKVETGRKAVVFFLYAHTALQVQGQATRTTAAKAKSGRKRADEPALEEGEKSHRGQRLNTGR